MDFSFSEDFSESVAFLEAAGYVDVLGHASWFNPRTMKCFSIEYVWQHSIREIKEAVEAETGNKGIVFYFIIPPTEYIRQILVEELKRRFNL